MCTLADKPRSTQSAAVVSELNQACQPPKGTDSPETRELCDQLLKPNGRLRALTLAMFADAA